MCARFFFAFFNNVIRMSLLTQGLLRHDFHVRCKTFFFAAVSALLSLEIANLKLYYHGDLYCRLLNMDINKCKSVPLLKMKRKARAMRILNFQDEKSYCIGLCVSFMQIQRLLFDFITHFSEEFTATVAMQISCGGGEIGNKSLMDIFCG